MYRLFQYGTDALRIVRAGITSRNVGPLVGGIAINDSCNLSCLHCSVSNRGYSDMNMEEVCTGLHTLRGLGIHTLFIEGGEPFFWKDGESTLEDIIEVARSFGFRSIVVYTNGTFPIETSADTVFVSLDGLRETNNRLRGPTFDTVIKHVRTSNHRNINVNYTINALNQGEIEHFCNMATRLPNVRGVFFYFHTPYGKSRELYLSRAERKTITMKLIQLKADGNPVLNSRAALRAVYRDTWDRPTDLCYIYARNKLYRCCRAVGDEETCKSCGYLSYAELYSITKLKPSAIWAAAKSV